jgi:probable F420-dependent oxidoreductase
MDYGFNISAKGAFANPELLARLAQHGEALGYSYLATSDHIIIPNRLESLYPYTLEGDFPAAATPEYLEPLTLLSFLAGVTRTLRLMVSVMVLPYRPPILAAKMLATMDVLSRGRVILGAGTGWMEEEFRILGLPFFEKRGQVTDEYLRAFRELWTKESPEFAGQFCHFSEFACSPKPVQTPSIPIWIGGSSRPALRRAGRLGNVWHPIVGNPADPLEPRELKRSLDEARRYASAAQRDPQTLQLVIKTSLYDRGVESVPGQRRRFTGAAHQIAEDLEAYRDVGVSGVFFDSRAPSVEQTFERLEWLARDVMTRVK